MNRSAWRSATFNILIGVSLSLGLLWPPVVWSDEGGDWQSEYESDLTQKMAAAGIPGIAVALVHRDKTVFNGGYGFADVERGRNVSPQTVFHICSMSKTVVGTALMMLWERGTFRLDEPISNHIDFTVQHPNFPRSDITFRQVFTHTSSISDENYGGESQPFSAPGDPTIPLRQFLTGYLTPDGEWYSTSGSYLAQAPGSTWSYSNVGMALAGHLVEALSGVPVDQFTQDKIFTPLGMTSAGWMLADVDRSQLATPYAYEEMQFRPLPHIGYPDWPAGLLRVSVVDFAAFIKIYTNNGEVNGASFLKASTIETMLRSTTYPTEEEEELNRQQGLFWLGLTLNDNLHMGHTGSDPGAAALVVFDEEHETAAIAIANGSRTPAVTDVLYWSAEYLLSAPFKS